MEGLSAENTHICAEELPLNTQTTNESIQDSITFLDDVKKLKVMNADLVQSYSEKSESFLQRNTIVEK